MSGRTRSVYGGAVHLARRLAAWWRRHPRATDTAIAVAITLIVQVDTWSNAWVEGSRPALAAAGLAMTVPLGWRTSHPVAVCAIVFAALGIQDVIAGSNARTPDAQLVAWIVATFSVAANADRAGALVGAAMALAATIGWLGIDDLVFPVEIVGGAWIAGRLVRSRQQRAVTLEHHTVSLDRERDARAQAAVADERARIARELHDVVAHSISVMGIQAGAVRRVLGPGHDEQKDALLSVEETGRQALAEMRRMLGILRRSDEDLAHAPPPSLDGIEELIAQAREAGLPVELRIEGERMPLAPGIDISAYRIVQEALTNTLKHAQPARATVVIAYGSHDLHLDVSDDGRGPGANGDVGHGLVGMRERVAIYGGSLKTGAGDDGGYVVRARLPLHADTQ
jgi:signal transduction histidine kinase